MELNVVNLLLILALAWITAAVVMRFGFPALLGELLAGLIFGPSLLGILRPDEAVNLLAQLGIFFLLFFAGMEMDPKELGRHMKSSLACGIGGAVIPFILGYYVTLAFGYSFHQALFVGMGLSVTSIATKARILSDLGVLKTRIGHIAVGAAVADDVIALVVFSGVLSIVTAGEVGALDLGLVMLKATLFFVVSIAVGYWVYPALGSRLSKPDTRTVTGFTFALIVALGFAGLAEFAGLHIILGAYLAGLFLREEIMSKELFDHVNALFSGITYGFLGPMFFVSLAFYVTFSALYNVIFFVVIIAAAVIGKILGSGVGCLLTGCSRGESLTAGVAMNGRGAVELVIALVGLEIGVLSGELFSFLILMAFVTTFMTPILLQLVIRRWRVEAIDVTHQNRSR